MIVAKKHAELKVRRAFRGVLVCSTVNWRAWAQLESARWESARWETAFSFA